MNLAYKHGVFKEEGPQFLLTDPTAIQLLGSQTQKSGQAVGADNINIGAARDANRRKVATAYKLARGEIPGPTRRGTFPSPPTLPALNPAGVAPATGACYS